MRAALLAALLVVPSVVQAAEGGDQGDADAEAVPELDEETVARAEAAADRYLAGEEAVDEADEAAARRAAELEGLAEDERRFLVLLGKLLDQSEAEAAEGRGRRAGQGFLAVRAELEELDEGLAERAPVTVRWLEGRVAALAPVLLASPDLEVPEAREDEDDEDAPAER